MKPVVSIILTDFQNIEKLGGLFPSHSERIHTSFGIRSNERPEILLTDHLRIHFLQLPKKINAKALAEVHPQLANWLTYFGFPEKTTEVDMEKVVNSNSNVASAYGAYCSFHLDPELRIIAENCERFRLDAEAYADSREEQGEIRGKIRGEIKGEIKGKIEGEIKGKIDSLIHILTKRLGPLPDNIMTKITALKDLAEIDRLADIALDVPSLEQFMNYFN